MRISKILSVFFVILSFLISAVSYFLLPLPQEVVIHWGLDGRPNFIVNKEVALSVIPIILLVVCAGLTFLNKRMSGVVINPEKNNKKNLLLANLLIFLIFIACQLFIVASALGYTFDAMMFGFYILAFTMILIGNYTSKNVPNGFIGLKNQWVRSCENTAREVNKLFGRLFFVGGAVCLILPFFIHDNLVPIQIGYILFVAVFLEITSKRVWKKYNTGK